MHKPPSAGRVLFWLAWRGLASSRSDTALRLAVAVTAVVIALSGLAMDATALARSARTAQNMLPMAPPDQQHSGIRVVETDDYFDGEPIRVRTVATVGHSPAGIPWRIPHAGELVVSPRMAELLQSRRPLAERYPGAVIGTLRKNVLHGPRDLVVWRAVPPSAMPQDAGWLIPGARDANRDIAESIPTELRFAVPMLVVGFLVPLLALLALVSTLGATRRERRLAAMRLVGLTDREARGAAVLESALLAAASCAVGLAVFRLLVPMLAPRLPVEDGVWPADVTLPVNGVIALFAGFPLLSMGANWLGLRALSTSPLGVEKRSHERRPNRWSLVPFALGLALLVVGLSGLVADPGPRSRIILVAALLLTVGLTGAIPFATRTVAAVLAKWAKGLSILVAARRMVADPLQASRAAVGLALLVSVAGPLLVFFPLIADGATADLSRLSNQVGGDTLIASASASEKPFEADRERGRELHRVEAQGRLSRTLAIDVVPMATRGGRMELSVGFVDCKSLERFTHIPVAACMRGLRASGAGPNALRGEFFAYREVETGPEGRVHRQPVGASVKLDMRLGRSSALKTLYDGLSTSTQVLLPKESVEGRIPVQGFNRLILASAADGKLERARTDVIAISDGEVLTADERYAIASRTTREFRSVAAWAGLLTVVVAALATLITSYEQVRRGTGERRLLWMTGANAALFRKALWVQNLTPSLLAVVPAALISLGLGRGLVDVVDRDAVQVPISGVVTVAVAALIATSLATQILSRFVRFDRMPLTEE